MLVRRAGGVQGIPRVGGLDLRRIGALAPHGLRTSLHEEELASPAGAGAQSPFDVHGPPEASFDQASELGHGDNLVCAERWLVLKVGLDVDDLHPARERVHPVRVLLAADFDACLARVFLADPEAVHADVPAHDALAQAERGLDVDLTAIAGDRLQGHHHARRLRRHHPLDHDGHREPLGGNGEAAAVPDGVRGEQARPAAQHVPAHLARPADAEIGVLLAGERGLGGVFGGRAGAHRDEQVQAAAELRVGGIDRRPKIGAQDVVGEQPLDRL